MLLGVNKEYNVLVGSQSIIMQLDPLTLAAWLQVLHFSHNKSNHIGFTNCCSNEGSSTTP